MEKPSFLIRRARFDEAHQLAKFLQPFVDQQLILPRTHADLGTVFANGFVAEDGDVLIGCAAVEIYSTKLAELQCLAVDAAHRGRGVGRALVNACVEHARDQGVRELMAITSSDGLFLNCGFHYALPGQKRAVFVQTSGE